MDIKSEKGPVNWLSVIVLTLAALPFLWGAAHTSYRSLWFKYAAERAEGTVVNVSTGTPDLTVEYRTKDGEVLRTETGGSDFYKGIAQGGKLTVFYDPQNPRDARVDLWLEHWITPILLVIPGGLIMLAMVLITSSLRTNIFARTRLGTGGTPVPADFVRVRLSVDLDSELDATRAPGNFRLTEQVYRMELPFQRKPPSKAQSSPITKM